jgi:hypothetical protein
VPAVGAAALHAIDQQLFSPVATLSAFFPTSLLSGDLLLQGSVVYIIMLRPPRDLATNESIVPILPGSKNVHSACSLTSMNAWSSGNELN